MLTKENFETKLTAN